MQHGAAERETLLPASRELGGEPLHVRCEPVRGDDRVHACTKSVRRKPIDTAIEREVLFDSEVVIQTELLRHVSNALAHEFGIGSYIDVIDARFAITEREQAGKHL